MFKSELFSFLDTYNEIFSCGRDVISTADLDVLKFALSVRNYSPRVQLHRQVIFLLFILFKTDLKADLKYDDTLFL